MPEVRCVKCDATEQFCAEDQAMGFGPPHDFKAASNGDRLYYIQDTRSFVGNNVTWWGSNRSGYTASLDDAGKYGEKEARDICANRDTDVMWPVERVEADSKRYLDMQVMRRWKDEDDA